MKRLIVSIICLLPLAVIGQTGFVINGKIGNVNTPAKAFLVYKTGTEEIIDSAVVSNGVFKFTGEVESPLTGAIHIAHDGSDDSQNKNPDVLGFYIENVELSITAPDSIKNATITGSPVNRDNNLLKAQLKPLADKMNALRVEYRSKSPEQQKDEAYIKTLNTRAEAIEKEMKPVYKDFAFKNTNSYIGLVAFRNYIGYDIKSATVESEFNQFSEEVRNTNLGKAISAAIEGTRRTMVGSMATDFTQNDVNDKPVKLSDFRGKYVLLDFWASWCGPCRVENPNVVAAYNAYKDKNFTVLGVSLDRPGKKEDWLKAIADDKLTWTNVSDLKFWNNEVARAWGIQSIPASFLIDPTGKIVAKNLRGEELFKKLEELLGDVSK